MGKVQGNWLTGAHSGRACRHQNIYTKVDKKTGACYSVQLCNPNEYRNDAQKKTATAFGTVSAVLSAWIKAEKANPTPSAEFLKVKAAFNRQTRYSTMRGMMMAKGMYKVVDGVVVVDPTAKTDFKTISSAVQLPEGGSANSPAAPAEKFTLTLTASPSAGGSVTGAGQYASGEQATINAVANSGYTFTRWSDGNTNAQRTLTISGDLTLQAVFSSDSSSDSGSAGGGGDVGGVD